MSIFHTHTTLSPPTAHINTPPHTHTSTCQANRTHKHAHVRPAPPPGFELKRFCSLLKVRPESHRHVPHAHISGEGCHFWILCAERGLSVTHIVLNQRWYRSLTLSRWCADTFKKYLPQTTPQQGWFDILAHTRWHDRIGRCSVEGHK